MSATCSTPGCGKPVRAKGQCWNHYQSARRRAAGVPARETMPDGVMLPPVRLDPTLDALMRESVAAEGVTLAEWVRRAVHERVLRRALEDRRDP